MTAPANAARPVAKASTTRRTNKTAAKPAAPAQDQTDPVDAAVTPASSDTDAPEMLELKKQELVNIVVDRSDIQKKYAKPVVEAVLAVLGEALASGRELNLQPLGKVKLNRTREMDEARVIVAKIRQNKPNVEPAASDDFS